MEARYAFRKSPLLDECQVAPEIFEQVMPRLETFMKPFVQIFQGQAATHHANTSVCGLLSNVERKNIESIAYRFGQARLPRQDFIGCDAWDDAPLRSGVAGPHPEALWAKATGCWCATRPGFPRPGGSRWGWHGSGVGAWAQSITARSPSLWALCPARGTPLVDTRLSLPKAWTKETRASTKRACPKRPAPLAPVTSWSWRCWRTRCRVPQRWMAGDDEMGRPSWVRRRLAALHERYLLAVPSNTSIRDLETALPPMGDRTPAHASLAQRAGRSQSWTEGLARIDVRDGAKGPLGGEAVNVVGSPGTPRRPQGDAEMLVGIRDRDRDHQQVVKGTILCPTLSRRRPWGPWRGWPRRTHRSEACLQRSTREAGVADDAGAIGRGWQQHQRSHSWPPGSWCGKPIGEKKWTPAMTVRRCVRALR